METNMRIEFIKRHKSAISVFPILVLITLGCLGPGSSSRNCEGVVRANGKTFKGTAAKKERASLNACNKYCLETDSEFDGMYRIWLDSSEGKAMAERKKRTPTKQEAIMENNRLLDYITKNCADRCYREANKGSHTLEVKCKK
jgi:hypothetical protein